MFSDPLLDELMSRRHVDVSEPLDSDPERDYEIILGELSSFEPNLSSRPMLLVASKLDLAGAGGRLRAVEQLAAQRKLPLFAVSSATGQGIEELKWAIARRLRELRPAEREPAEDRNESKTVQWEEPASLPEKKPA